MENVDDVQKDEATTDLIIPLFSESSVKRQYLLHGTTSIAVEPRPSTEKFKESSERLFVDDIWPGCLVLSDFLVHNETLVSGKTVLELGAGVALPSFVSAHLRASKVVVTDFPAPGVLRNIEKMARENRLSSNCTVLDHIWGDDVHRLVEKIYPLRAFDVILMAEVLWKDTYTQHRNLLRSVSLALSSEGTALVAFAHRPTEDHPKSR